MSEPIVYVDRSRIREGRLDEFKSAMNGLVALVESNEPRLIAYAVYLDEAVNEVTVVHVHRDRASLEHHMRVAGPAFPRFAAFLRMLSIDVYGEPGAEVVERLREKAALLGTGTVRIHSLHAGFGRFDAD